MNIRTARLDSQIDSVKQEIVSAKYAVRGELVTTVASQTRTIVFALIGTVLSLAALARFI